VCVLQGKFILHKIEWFITHNAWETSTCVRLHSLQLLWYALALVYFKRLACRRNNTIKNPNTTSGDSMNLEVVFDLVRNILLYIIGFLIMQEVYSHLWEAGILAIEILSLLVCHQNP
jgi:hypothetical protein